MQRPTSFLDSWKTSTATRQKIGILLFTASPDADLRLGLEIRQIAEILESADLSGVCGINTIHETRPEDLALKLDLHKGGIVQFRAHGDTNRLVLACWDRRQNEVRRITLASPLRDRRGRDRVGVLGACKIKALGRAICDEVGCVTSPPPGETAERCGCHTMRQNHEYS